jgi:hypothetical protein
VKKSANRKTFTSWAAIAALAIAGAWVPTASANPNSDNTLGHPAGMVARVELSGGPITRMLLVKKKHKEYLVAELSSSPNVALLDVTDPARPRTVATAPGSTGTPAAELQILADTLALFGTAPAKVESEPKEIRGVAGVTAFLTDKDHGLIYTGIGNQLWIVKTKLRAHMDEAPDAATLYYGGGD